MKWILLIISLILISGCKNTEIVTEIVEKTVYRDSIVLKDTTIYKEILGMSIIDTFYINVPKEIPIPKDTAKAEVEFAYALAYINSRWNVQLELHQKDTLIKIIEHLKMESYKWENKYRTEKQIIIQKIKYIPKFYKIAFWIIIIEFALLIGYGIKKFGIIKKIL